MGFKFYFYNKEKVSNALNPVGFTIYDTTIEDIIRYQADSFITMNNNEEELVNKTVDYLKNIKIPFYAKLDEKEYMIYTPMTQKIKKKINKVYDKVKGIFRH